MSEWTL